MEPNDKIARVDLRQSQGRVRRTFERSSTEQQIYTTLQNLGYDPIDDENFRETPRRAADWLLSFQKIDENHFLEDVLTPVFPEDHDEMVIVDHIPFVSLCPHHLIPFHGVGHIGYIPSKGVVGISKLARALVGIASQCVMQERITRVVADGIHQILEAKGVMVVLEAEHGCMTFRGVQAQGARTRTSAVRGVFETNDAGCKDEFLRLIGR